MLALGAKVAKASVNVLLASVGTAKKSDGGGVGSRKNALVLAVPFRAGLGDLPVVGPLLPHGIDVGVAGLGLLAASADFAKTECDTINAQLPEHAARMPSPLKAGVAVLVEAALGRDTQSIELRLPKKGHRGTVAFGDGGAGGVQAVAWWDISRALGPVRIERFGARYAAGSIGALLDAQVSAGGLTLEPRGLGVTVPLKAPHTPSVCLDGLGIGLDRPPVKLAAALLLQSPPPAGYRFAVAGMAVIEVAGGQCGGGGVLRAPRAWRRAVVVLVRHAGVFEAGRGGAAAVPGQEVRGGVRLQQCGTGSSGRGDGQFSVSADAGEVL